jgi:hypothetical protein
MAHCAKCGALLPPGAQFCSKCGTPVAAPPAPPANAPSPVVPTPPQRSTWWIVPLVIVALVVIAWLLLAGLPFGGREEKRVAGTTTVETIAEGTSPNATPPDTGTVVDVETSPVDTQTVAPPPLSTQTVAPVPIPQPSTAPPPNPVVIEQRPPVTPPRPAPVPPPREERAEEITDGEALSTLRGYLASNNPYDVSGDCLQTRSMGYRNVGYTFSVWDACVAGGGSRMLGRWRVDARTREIFRQSDDGRYLRP